MKEWWSSLQSKEQLLVSIAGILVVILLLYFIAWMPLLDSRNNKKLRVENKQETLIWMTQKKQEVEHLKRINPNLFNQTTDKRSLLAIVDTGAKQMRVRSSITRIEPNGEDKVQLWLENMIFDHLIVLLGELGRRNHIEVADANLTKAGEIGKVSGRITLNK